MNQFTDLPGTSNQQQLLNWILDYYKEDARIRAILLFGSLGRGDWDEYSDLDLDIIMIDGTSIDARVELANICAFIREEYGLEALILADDEEGDVVLSNLLEFSIRFHILSDTKPAILGTMRLLMGTVTLQDIHDGVNPVYSHEPINQAEIVDLCLRYALGLRNAILRERVWISLEFLHRIRGLLMNYYANEYNSKRPIQFFDANASDDLQLLLRKLNPPAELKQVEKAFNQTLILLENRLNDYVRIPINLTKAQDEVLRALMQRDVSSISK